MLMRLRSLWSVTEKMDVAHVYQGRAYVNCNMCSQDQYTFSIDGEWTWDSSASSTKSNTTKQSMALSEETTIPPGTAYNISFVTMTGNMIFPYNITVSPIDVLYCFCSFLSL